MSVRVIVPWEAGCDQRERVWTWLRSRWSLVGWPVTVAERFHRNQPWVKADAVMPAVAAADEDVLVIADADVWCDGVAEAVTRVNAGAPWAVPHRLVHRLNHEATARALDGGPLSTDRADLVERPYPGIVGGGIVVIRRDVAIDVPLDSRFAGWGGEDHAWAYALTTLHGKPWRGDSHLHHLWHPPQQRRSRVFGSELSDRLRRRYHRAQTSPDVMRALVEEAKEVTSARFASA